MRSRIVTRWNVMRFVAVVAAMLVAVTVAGLYRIEALEPPWMRAARAGAIDYRDQLVHALRENGRVEIIEHSWVGDRPGSGGADPMTEYQRIELSPQLREELARRIEAMDTDPQVAVVMCFSPHHRIEFSPAAGEPSRMLVCFSCHRVEWDRVEDGSPPAALIGLLEKFFAELKLRPHGDWTGMAAPRRQSAAF